MKAYLKDLVDGKKQITKEKQLNIKELEKQISLLEAPVSFLNALKKEGLSIIGEIKKASPSKGLIVPDFKPMDYQKEYETCVDAISVLTEERKFLGSDEFLKDVSGASKLPTLCKDFITTKEQIAHARVLGASAVLLIVAILTEQELSELYFYANSLDLDVLIETHNAEEIEIALRLNPEIIGINNRNLDTFETTLDTTIRLRTLIPEGVVVISESAIFSKDDISYLNKVNYDAILVGESFMRTTDKTSLAKEFRDAYRKR